jgi:predicted dehydrogenase
MSKIRIGLIGLGHLGSIHAKLLPQIVDGEFVAVYDVNTEKKQEIASTLNIHPAESIDDLLDRVDAVDIVTPTSTHHEIALIAIRRNKHVFLEKPITENVDQAHELTREAEEHGVFIQVGHIERFNPAIVALNDHKIDPLFVESHRLAQFNPRGTDVPVVLDLMIHDIDIILSLVDSEVESIDASGVAVVSEHADIANARIQFKNGCVANITASRISQNRMRKMRLFQKDAYLAIDFLQGQSEVFRLVDSDDTSVSPTFMLGQIEQGAVKRNIIFEQPPAPEDHNPLKYELQLFINAVHDGEPPVVNSVVAARALEVAEQIIEKITSST